MSIALIGLGANLHDRAAALRDATSRLAAVPQIRLIAASSSVETAAVGGPANQPPFLNAALLVETTLAPPRIASELLACEAALGRRREQRWGPRTIDLDLLLFDDRVVDSPELILPHPRMAFRRFVLEPACEIAATMLHPLSGWQLSRLLAHLDSRPDYIAVAGGGADVRTQVVREVTARTDARPVSLATSSQPGCPPAGGGSASLKWLEEAARVLAPATWASDARPAISDFWFDEPVVTAAEVDAADANEMANNWKTLRATIVQPKLVVWLDDEPRATHHIHGETLEDGEEVTGWLSRQSRQRRAFYSHVLTHDIGPTLRLEAGASGQPADEIVAALAAMRPMIEHHK